MQVGFFSLSSFKPRFLKPLHDHHLWPAGAAISMLRFSTPQRHHIFPSCSALSAPTTDLTSGGCERWIGFATFDTIGYTGRISDGWEGKWQGRQITWSVAETMGLQESRKNKKKHENYATSPCVRSSRALSSHVRFFEARACMFLLVFLYYSNKYIHLSFTILTLLLNDGLALCCVLSDWKCNVSDTFFQMNLASTFVCFQTAQMSTAAPSCLFIGLSTCLPFQSLFLVLQLDTVYLYAGLFLLFVHRECRMYV